MSIRVLRPGLLTTLQDLGRHGLQHVGLCPGGAMDSVALSLANALVGNPRDEAALEITVIGPELAFEEDTLVAVGGADHFTVPSRVFLSVENRAAAAGSRSARTSPWRRARPAKPPKAPGR